MSLSSNELDTGSEVGAVLLAPFNRWIALSDYPTSSPDFLTGSIAELGPGTSPLRDLGAKSPVESFLFGAAYRKTPEYQGIRDKVEANLFWSLEQPTPLEPHQSSHLFEAIDSWAIELASQPGFASVGVAPFEDFLTSAGWSHRAWLQMQGGSTHRGRLRPRKWFRDWVAQLADALRQGAGIEALLHIVSAAGGTAERLTLRLLATVGVTTNVFRDRRLHVIEPGAPSIWRRMPAAGGATST